MTRPDYVLPEDEEIDEFEEQDFYEQDTVKLQTRVDPNRELTRYLFCIGDHIEPRDKQNLMAPVGGMWIGHSEVEGAPTMKRTRFMLHTCGVTPLENVSIPKKADHRAEKKSEENFLIGKGVPGGTRGYMVYAGDSLNYLQNDRFRPQGIVEIFQLMGKEWATGIAEKIQLFFFPDWFAWLRKSKPFPKTIDDRVSIVREAMLKADGDPVLTGIGDLMLESARLFTQFGSSHIERNRQMIQSMRNTNMGGFYIGWTEKTRLFALQLKLRLEDENQLRQEAGGTNIPSNDALIEQMRLDRELREKELEVQKQQNSLLLALVTGKITGIEALSKFVPVKIEEPVVKSTSENVTLEKSEEDEKDIITAYSPDLHDVSLGQANNEIATPLTVEEGTKEIVYDGQCHGIRKKTQDRCKMKNLPDGVLYCATHIGNEQEQIQSDQTENNEEIVN